MRVAKGSLQRKHRSRSLERAIDDALLGRTTRIPRTRHEPVRSLKCEQAFGRVSEASWRSLDELRISLAVDPQFAHVGEPEREFTPRAANVREKDDGVSSGSLEPRALREVVRFAQRNRREDVCLNRVADPSRVGVLLVLEPSDGRIGLRSIDATPRRVAVREEAGQRQRRGADVVIPMARVRLRSCEPGEACVDGALFSRMCVCPGRSIRPEAGAEPGPRSTSDRDGVAAPGRVLLGVVPRENGLSGEPRTRAHRTLDRGRSRWSAFR